jgi:hypothetical protein
VLATGGGYEDIASASNLPRVSGIPGEWMASTGFSLDFRASHSNNPDDGAGRSIVYDFHQDVALEYDGVVHCFSADDQRCSAGIAALSADSGRFVAAETTATEGMQLFRVFGGEAQGLGRYYTTVNPGSLSNFREAAGLFRRLTMFCCPGFENLIRNAGNKGITAIVRQTPDGIRFCLQATVAKVEDLQALGPLPINLTLAAETGLRYCPACGRCLQELVEAAPKEYEALAKEHEKFLLFEN